MDGSAVYEIGTIVIRGFDPGIHRTFKDDELPGIGKGQRRRRPDVDAGQGQPDSTGPGERDFVERLRPEFLRGARYHPSAQRAVEFRREIVIGERPYHHAL